MVRLLRNKGEAFGHLENFNHFFKVAKTQFFFLENIIMNSIIGPCLNIIGLYIWHLVGVEGVYVFALGPQQL